MRLLILTLATFHGQVDMDHRESRYILSLSTTSYAVVDD